MCKKIFVFFLGKGLQFLFIFMMVQGLFVPAALVHADTGDDDCKARSRPVQSPPRPGYYNPVSPLDRGLCPAATNRDQGNRGRWCYILHREYMHLARKSGSFCILVRMELKAKMAVVKSPGICQRQPLHAFGKIGMIRS